MLYCLILKCHGLKRYNIVWQAVSGKLSASQIPVGFASTGYHLCPESLEFWAYSKQLIRLFECDSAVYGCTGLTIDVARARAPIMRGGGGWHQRICLGGKPEGPGVRVSGVYSSFVCLFKFACPARPGEARVRLPGPRQETRN